jgi:hypothetical protein
MGEIKLTKSQRELYLSWIKDFRAVLTSMNSVIDELLSTRMQALALELGINIEDGDWRFDAQALSFRKVKETPASPNPTEEIKDAEIVDDPEVPHAPARY